MMDKGDHFLSAMAMITYRYRPGSDGIVTVYALAQDCLMTAASLAEMGAITILVGPAGDTSGWW
jgi:hypothetical protein